ncbi:winged helix-turn-helix domain-containing protein [Streptomyces sp. NBC_00378]|uniref:winged helix-turn-helix domain-containing protein n=1 Tax=unclassified Streptomyces TaxID=2593676 RepID=UPI00224F12E6|nr:MULTISPECIES: winged helix-turn-helix domain-containing protein [unclassified Streptomyces]MCX5113124.1 winged helix-turn-helix domain-containing protein [Streptomyces sp. NBC_00378]
MSGKVPFIVPAIDAFLAVTAGLGLGDEVLTALREDVLPVCVGPVCGRRLEEAEVAVLFPERGRLGAMVRTVEAALPAHARREVRAGPSTLVLQGNAVLIDDDPPVRLPPLLAAVLRALAEQPGRVLGRAELLRRVWVTGQADEHAVEAAVARLRGALDGHARLVRTVPKRGYSLAAAT